MSVPKTYNLTEEQKDAIAEYLAGDLSQKALAIELDTDRQLVPTVMTAILRFLVSNNRVDIKRELKHY